jgi:hypothetical protein
MRGTFPGRGEKRRGVLVFSGKYGKLEAWCGNRRIEDFLFTFTARGSGSFSFILQNAFLSKRLIVFVLKT